MVDSLLAGGGGGCCCCCCCWLSCLRVADGAMAPMIVAPPGAPGPGVVERGISTGRLLLLVPLVVPGPGVELRDMPLWEFTGPGVMLRVRAVVVRTTGDAVAWRRAAGGGAGAVKAVRLGAPEVGEGAGAAEGPARYGCGRPIRAGGALLLPMLPPVPLPFDTCCIMPQRMALLLGGGGGGDG